MKDIDPVALTRRYHDALNRFTVAEVEPMFAEDATYRSPSVGLLAGREAIIGAMKGYFAEFPDQVAEDETVEAVGPRVARCVWRLTATSSTSGKPSIRRGTETLTFTSEGRILSIEVNDL